MKWEKLGLVFTPLHGCEWMHSHAAAPAPLKLSEDVCRVFFASRDAKNSSRVGYFDVNLNRPTKILAVSEKPVIAPGPLGYFDDHGVYASSAVMSGDKIFLYTIGWNPGNRQPLFYSSIGLAISENGGRTFEKFGHSPIMARSDYDPCLVTAPVVIKECNKWRMWYVSGIGWSDENSTLHSTYHVKYAESFDGISWRREGVVCLDNSDPLERNIGRTCVLKLNDGYHAWYCSDRGAGYRIGYARSDDGLLWERSPTPLGLEPSLTGWDSEAMAYPYVVVHRAKLFMFYNGNGFGRDGVGIAVFG